jgi:hypothetical protein
VSVRGAFVAGVLAGLAIAATVVGAVAIARGG